MKAILFAHWLPPGVILSLAVAIGVTVPVAARGAQPSVAAEIVIADFESETYGDWKTTGDAFGPGPARGALPGQMAVEGFKGRGLVNSFYHGDTATGTLTSPEFKLERKFLCFLIGGGRDSEKTCMNLLVGGRIVRTATGPNDRPGGTEALAPDSWDVSEWVGQTAVLQIVDQATGPWGHLNVDHLVQSDHRPPRLLTDVRRDFKIDKRYLNLPIKNGAPKRKVTTSVEGVVEVVNDVELAPGEADWWAFIDVSRWRGKTVTLQVDKMLEDATSLQAIEQSDSLKDQDPLYHEALRGQFHFSSRRGWINDPNGLVFYHGEYHLFYQHNPYGWDWGNMHWGHAVSRDLIHWHDLGDALAPDSFGPMFSGSAVVDWKNSSGLGQDGQPPLVLLYTAAGKPTVQCLASSIDGRTFTKFPGNPVIHQISDGNRDPKVFWHESTKSWVMVFYVELPGTQHSIHFLTSPNLREWTLASVTQGGVAADHFLFECPDFFELPVDGVATNKKWVLTAANSDYAVGQFDGRTFASERAKLPGQRGRGFYAAQTFSDLPAKDGRRIQIGWFQTSTPGMPFNHSMTVPLELRLVGTLDGPRMTYTPVKELESLRTKSHRYQALTLEPDSASPWAGVKAELLELRAEFDPGEASEVAFLVRGASIVYEVKKEELVVNGHRTAAPARDRKQRLTIFCDRTGLEVFASDGLTYVPLPFTPKRDELSVDVRVRGGSVKFSTLEVHELKSLWE